MTDYCASMIVPDQISDRVRQQTDSGSKGCEGDGEGEKDASGLRPGSDAAAARLGS